MNKPREEDGAAGEAKDGIEDELLVPELGDAGGEWVVLRTRPRCEKQVARHCQTANIHYYLPLLSRTHRYGGRVRSFESPLFPGYVFCRLGDDQFEGIRHQRNVARMLRTPDQAGLVRQLQSIRRALEDLEVVEVMPFLAEGNPVVVRSGRLKGVEGVIKRLKGKTRVIINVEMIQQSVAIEIDSQDLAPL